MVSLPRSLVFGVALLCAGGVVQARGDEPGVRVVGVAGYRGHLEILRALVQACRQDAVACDAKKVGEDERVENAGFQARWSWLRETIVGAHDPKQQDRERLLQEAEARLDEDATLAVAMEHPRMDEFGRARAGADRILSEPEFRTVTEQSYLEREIAAFYQWLERVFGGVSRFGRRSPWLVPLVEWSSITLAAAGLLAWVWRTMQRQRLAIAFEAGAKAEVWQKESDDWAELARVEAARQEWRAAVHCLYWATIVMMEGRKLWRQNRARTPREYVMLLEQGSRMEQGLRRLTQIFERIWYGLRPAAESDYDRALALFDELRAA